MSDKNKNYIIRKGEKKDIPALFELVKELAIFEKAENQLSNSVEKMCEDGFGKQAIFSFLVAQESEQNTIVGTGIYFYSYSTWKGKSIYLDDLIVKESWRCYGIGTALLKELLKIKKQEKINQIHWQVLDWNSEAINFYKKFNVTFDPKWINCKIVI